MPVAIENRVDHRARGQKRALDFSVLTGVRPRIETMPLERAQQAYDRMKSGAVRFRMVLTMGDVR